MSKPFFAGILVSLLFSQTPTLISAQEFSDPTTGVTVVQNGLWSTLNNPAGLSSITGINAGFYYQSGFLMHELSDAGFALAFPAGKFSIVGLSYRQYGYSLYKEQQIGIVLAKQLGKLVNAGIRFDYLSIAFGNDYGKTSLFTGSAGVQVKVTSEITVGVSVFNPQRAKFGDETNTRYDAKIAAGIGWRFGKNVMISLGAEKEGSVEEQITCAMNYSISKKFTIIAGVGNGTKPFYFGYTYRFGSLEIGMNSGYHHLLGFSPQFLFTYKKQ